MTRIALVTAAAARTLDEDLPPLVAALSDAGADPTVVDWDDPAADWSRFDLALLRSAWDYSQRLPEFLRWVDRVSTQTVLLNPAQVVRWNTDKHYLAHLDAPACRSCRARSSSPATTRRPQSRVSSRRPSTNSSSSRASAPARATRSATRARIVGRGRARAAPARREPQRAAAAVPRPRRRARRDRADVFRRRASAMRSARDRCCAAEKARRARCSRRSTSRRVRRAMRSSTSRRARSPRFLSKGRCSTRAST